MPLADINPAGKILVDGVGFRDRDSIREVPGSKWKTGEWTVPLTYASVVVLRSIFGDRLSVGESLKKWAWTEYEARVRPMLEARALALEEDADTPGDERLWSLQRTGVAFLRAARGAVLADHMGMGKTLQGLMTLEADERYPALVVCPNSVKMVWQREYEKWAPHRKVVVVDGSAKKRRDALAEPADVYVINWEAIRLHSRIAGYGSIKLTDKDREPLELNRPWKAVIADEAHHALKPKAKQTRALWAIGETSEFKLPLTGTPIAGSPEDLWSLLHFVDAEEWPSRTKYIDRYCLTSWNTFGGIEVIGLRPDRQEEFHSLVSARMLRRPKSWLNLPGKAPVVTRLAPMTPKQAKAYKELSEEYVTDVEGGTLVEFSPLTVATRLCQLASSCVSVDEDGSVHLANPSNKINVLTEVLEEMGDDTAAVFAVSPSLIKLAVEHLESRGVSTAQIVGGMTMLQKSSALDDFVAGRARVILLTYGAAAEGVDGLQKATSTQIYLQKSWKLIENLQADERVDRPGQKDVVTTINIVAPDTIEEDQYSAVEAKGDRLEEIVRDRDSLRRVLKR